jgi:hypothetical protein
MKNINMRRLISEDYIPTNTDKYPIKQIKGEVDPDTKKQPIYQIGLSDNLLVFRRMGEDGKFSGEWLKFDSPAIVKKLKGIHYNLLDEKGNVISIFDDTPEKRASSSETKTKTKGKCLPLTTPPAGLTLNITNPGDKNYIYGKVGEEWFAQNVKNKKIFNLTKCNYTTSITKLEKLKTGSANASVEQLQNQSKEIQKSAGLPETGSFDIQTLEKLIKLLSDEEQPKVQSVQDSIPNAKIQTPNAEEQLKQIASQQTIRQ